MLFFRYFGRIIECSILAGPFLDLFICVFCCVFEIAVTISVDDTVKVCFLM